MAIGPRVTATGTREGWNLRQDVGKGGPRAASSAIDPSEPWRPPRNWRAWASSLEPRVHVRFRPAPIDTPGLSPPRSAARRSSHGPRRVRHRHRPRTTLGSANHSVTLVEHLLAALAGLRIDNCFIELDGPEPPGLDGSADGFVVALAAAGIVNQTARAPSTHRVLRSWCRAVRRRLASIQRPVSNFVPVTCWITASSRRSLVRHSRSTFAPAISPEKSRCCRTFVTTAEAEALRTQGIGTHLTPADIVVFGDRGTDPQSPALCR